MIGHDTINMTCLICGVIFLSFLDTTWYKKIKNKNDTALHALTRHATNLKHYAIHKII
jgi:hypothetical protein